MNELEPGPVPGLVNEFGETVPGLINEFGDTVPGRINELGDLDLPSGDASNRTRAGDESCLK